MGAEVSKLLRSEGLDTFERSSIHESESNEDNRKSSRIAATWIKNDSMFEFCKHWNLRILLDFLRFYMHCNEQHQSSKGIPAMMAVETALPAIEEAEQRKTYLDSLIDTIQNEISDIVSASTAQGDKKKERLSSLDARKSRIARKKLVCEEKLAELSQIVSPAIASVDLSIEVRWKILNRTIEAIGKKYVLQSSETTVETSIADLSATNSATRHPACGAYLMNRIDTSEYQLYDNTYGQIPPSYSNDTNGDTDQSADISDSDSSMVSESSDMSIPAEGSSLISKDENDCRSDEQVTDKENSNVREEIKTKFKQDSASKKLSSPARCKNYTRARENRLASSQHSSMLDTFPKLNTEFTLKAFSASFNAGLRNPVFFCCNLDKVTTQQAFAISTKENAELEHEKQCIEQKVQQLNAKLEQSIASEDAKLRALTQKEKEYHEKRDKFWSKRLKDLEQARAELNSEDLTLQSRENQQSHIRNSYDQEDREIQSKKIHLEEKMQNARTQRNLEVNKLRNMVESEEPLGASRLEYHEQEIRRYEDEIHSARNFLEKAQEDFVSFRSYNNHTLVLPGSKQDRQQRGQLLHIEGQIRRYEKELKSLCTLFENELYLLERSKMVYQRESRLAPLYNSLRGCTKSQTLASALGRAPTLLDVAVAFLIGMKKPSLTTRIKFLFNIYAAGSSYALKSTKRMFKDSPSDMKNQIRVLTCKSFTLVLQQVVQILMRLLPMQSDKSLTQEKIQGIAQREYLLLMRSKEWNSTCLRTPTSTQGQLLRFGTSKELANSHVLTCMEFTEFCIACIKRSPQLSRFFGQQCSCEHLGRYLMQNISATHRYKLGLVPVENLKYVLTRRQLEYREELSPWSKLKIHKMALAMGKFDTLKANYRVDLRAQKVNALSNVIPLNHGGYHNALYQRKENMQLASTRIQSRWRGKQGRRRAIFLAQKQAFYHAKAVELQHARDKIVMEWKDKETQSDTDSGRLEQAISSKKIIKKKVTNIAMGEKIRKAQNEIEDRFREMEEELGCVGHGSQTKVEKHNLSLKQEISTILIQKISDAKREVGYSPQLHSMVKKERSHAADVLEQKRIEETDSTQQRLQSSNFETNNQTEEQRPSDFYGSQVSESNEEDLQSSDAPLQLVYSYLRIRCDGLTPYKFRELSLELPSKRHICNYVCSFRRMDGKYEHHKLEMDLVDHFRIKKSTSPLVLALIELTENDACFGLTYALLHKLRCENEQIYLMSAFERGIRLSRSTPASLKTPDSTVSITNSTSVHDVLPSYSSLRDTKKLDLIAKHKSRATEAYEKMVHAMLEWKRVERSLQETENDEVQSHGLGICTDHIDWSGRLNQALQLPELSEDEIRDKYVEIYNICHNFLHTATAVAMIIAQEATLPLSSRSIIPLYHLKADGRKDSIRPGIKRTYEVHNIRFELSIDDHGRYESCDEFAAKFYGHEVRNSALYMRSIGSSINFLLPLQCCVDTRGFRVLCTSVLPVDTNSLTNEFGYTEIHTGEQNLIQGTKDHGKVIIASSKRLRDLLSSVSKELNTSQHFVRGSQDLVQRSIYGPSDLQIYSLAPDRYMLLSFARAMPPEDPAPTKHLIASTRGMSILWRQLRSEFVRTQKRALSPDALFSTTYSATDCFQQAKDVEDATIELLNTVIPRFAKEMCQNAQYYLSLCNENSKWSNSNQEIEDGKNEFEVIESGWNKSALTRGMHRHGINVRHLGLLRAHLKSDDAGEFFCEPIATKETNHLSHLAQTSNLTPCESGCKSMTRSSSLQALVLAEMVARTLKNVIRHFLREEAKQTKTGLNSAFLNYVIVQTLNLFTGGRRGSDSFWKTFLIRGVRVRFGNIALSQDEESNARTDAVPWFHYIVRRVSDMLGLSLTAGSLLRIRLSPNGYTFSSEDFLAGRDCQFGDIRTPQSVTMCRVKSNLSVLHFAMGSLLSLEGSVRQSCTYKEVVLTAQPHGYWPLSETKGTTKAFNLGLLGTDLTGNYIGKCELEGPGFVCNSEYNRAVRFRRDKRAFVNYVDSHVPLIQIQDTMSMIGTLEAWCSCEGLCGRRQTIVAVGCLSLDIIMSDHWAVILQNQSVNVIAQGPPVSLNRWTYLSATLNGTTLRLYVNGRLEREVNWRHTIRNRSPLQGAPVSENKARLENLSDEKQYIASEKEEHDCNSEDGKFFKWLKMLQIKPRRKTAKIRWSTFGKRDYDKSPICDKSSGTLFRLNKLEMHSTSNCKEQSEPIGLDDIQGRHDKDRTNSLEKAQIIRPTRIACLFTDRSRDGKYFFQGLIAHVACYHNKTLAHEDINKHYVIGTQNRAGVLDHFLDLAVQRFARTLSTFDPHDHSTLRHFAKNVCASRNHHNESIESIINQKRRICLAVNALILAKCVHGIAEIMRNLPLSPRFSDLFISCYQSILQEDPSYFRPKNDPSCQFALEDLAEIPFALFFIPGNALSISDILPDDHVLLPECDMRYAYDDCQSFGSNRGSSQGKIVQTFADILIRTVTKVPYFFSRDSPTNVKWLGYIINQKLILHCALRLRKDGFLDNLCFEDIPDISTRDFEVIVRNNTNCKCLSIPSCKFLAERTIKETILVCQKLQELDLSYCDQLHDSFLDEIAGKCAELKKLAVAHCHQISDIGLVSLLRKLGCRLESLDISHCEQLTDASLTHIVALCTMLQDLNSQWCLQFTSKGFQRIEKCTSFSNSLERINISGCKKIETEGIVHLAECCTNLQHIILNSCERITSRSISALMQKCTHLKTLHMQDLVLVTSELLSEAQLVDNMSQQSTQCELSDLSLSGCTDIDDEAFRYFCTQIADLKFLNLSSCTSLTQDVFHCFAANANRCTSALEILDLSFCPQFNPSDVELLTTNCHRLISLNLSGLITLNNTNVNSIIKYCPHLAKLHLGFCRELNDSILHSIAANLTLQYLNIERCNKMTDDGILAFIDDNYTLQSLNISSCKLITDRVMLFLMKSCPRLRTLNIELCSQITLANISALRRKRSSLNVIYSDFAKQTGEISKFDAAFLYKPQAPIYNTRNYKSDTKCD